MKRAILTAGLWLTVGSLIGASAALKLSIQAGIVDVILKALMSLGILLLLLVGSKIAIDVQELRSTSRLTSERISTFTEVLKRFLGIRSERNPGSGTADTSSKKQQPPFRLAIVKGKRTTDH